MTVIMAGRRQAPIWNAEAASYTIFQEKIGQERGDYEGREGREDGMRQETHFPPSRSSRLRSHLISGKWYLPASFRRRLLTGRRWSGGLLDERAQPVPYRGELGL